MARWFGNLGLLSATHLKFLGNRGLKVKSSMRQILPLSLGIWLMKPSLEMILKRSLWGPRISKRYPFPFCRWGSRFLFPGEMTIALSCLETRTGTQSRKHEACVLCLRSCLSLCVWSWTSCLSSLSTSFFICKMEKPPCVMLRTSNEEMEWDGLYKGGELLFYSSFRVRLANLRSLW